MNKTSLFIPVILGTTRKGRASENVATFVFGEVQKREGVETDLIDIRNLGFPVDDAGEAIKEPKFSEAMNRADGVVLVVPEYNHGIRECFSMCWIPTLKNTSTKRSAFVGFPPAALEGSHD